MLGGGPRASPGSCSHRPLERSWNQCVVALAARLPDGLRRDVCPGACAAHLELMQGIAGVVGREGVFSRSCVKELRTPSAVVTPVKARTNRRLKGHHPPRAPLYATCGQSFHVLSESLDGRSPTTAEKQKRENRCVLALLCKDSARLFGVRLTTTDVSHDQRYPGKLYHVLTSLPVGVRNGPGAPVLTMI